MVTKQAALDSEEVWRVNRVRLAMLLHRLPHEIDTMPFQDVVDVMEVERAERMYTEVQQAKRGWMR